MWHSLIVIHIEADFKNRTAGQTWVHIKIKGYSTPKYFPDSKIILYWICVDYLLIALFRLNLYELYNLNNINFRFILKSLNDIWFFELHNL